MNGQESATAQANKTPVVVKVGPMVHEGTIMDQSAGKCTIETTMGYKIKHVDVQKVSLKQN